MNEKTKSAIENELSATNRRGIDKLIDYLNESGFFTAPASTRFHNAFEGGLADHSHNVFKLFNKQVSSLELNVPYKSVVISSLLHDLCKAGAYISEGGSYYWNHSQPSGHAKLSIERIEKFIELTETEKNLIKFHMGLYGTGEFDKRNGGEYSLMELVNASNQNKAVSLFYWCDDFEAKFGEKYFSKQKG
ncbi:MAG: metal-dependent phosphohydrolase [Planctomycetes bacterium]|nr:metal-dependent phosphohydrolase [Planctomycetota bacterium]